MSYYFKKTVEIPFDQAVAQVTERLKEYGFGVLTEIDVRATLKKKLDVDFPNYQILGACNPPFAYRALLAEPEIGLLMPCNVVVRENAEGKVEVSAVDPLQSMSSVDNPNLADVAAEVRDKLREVIETL
jgi:uncharacterized protein (DUF302 family)